VTAQGKLNTGREGGGGGYVLVTPVRDEVNTIGRTIDAVRKQTRLPMEWVIVSDGSTDGTNDVVAAAIKDCTWINLMMLPSRPSRSFAAVVRNTEAGVAALRCTDYAFLGLLDADVEFPPHYFERLVARFDANHALGLAGGVVVDPGSPKDRVPRNRVDVPGAVQMFRRECFEQLGGLIAVPEGGWDCLTCVMARMAGFETQLVPELVVDHLKPRNAAQGSRIRGLWQLGARDYALGYGVLFEGCKSLARASERPLLIASLARWCGFCAALIARRPRVVPDHVIAFIREEQRKRIRRAWVVTPRRTPKVVETMHEGRAAEPGVRCER